MWIDYLADDSHEIPSLIFSKINNIFFFFGMSSATILLSNPKINLWWANYMLDLCT